VFEEFVVNGHERYTTIFPYEQNRTALPLLWHLDLIFILVCEAQADRVDTVPLIRWRRIALPFEDVSQVSSASRTYNLRPCHTKGPVGMTGDSTRDTVVVCRPAAAGLEFVAGTINWCFTCCALLWIDNQQVSFGRNDIVVSIYIHKLLR